MSKPFFTRPPDGWYQIERKGEHPNRRAGVIQIINNPAIASIVNSFNAAADAGRLSHGHEMLIDHEHFRHDLNKESTAYGWLNRLEARDDGYYGRIRWTTVGDAAIDGGAYRFFSTEYDPADVMVLNQEGKWKRVRPLRLDGLSLTNTPNNKGGKPITNRGGTGPNPPTQTPGTAGSQEEAAKLLTQLALDEERASGVSFFGAFRTVMNRETDLVSLASGDAADAAAAGGWARAAGRLLAAAAAREQRRGESYFAVHRRVCGRCPTLVKIANRAAPSSFLLDLEAEAKTSYSASVNGPVVQDDPDLLPIAILMRRLSVLFPKLTFDQLWDQAKQMEPSTFWGFVLSFGLADSEPSPAR